MTTKRNIILILIAICGLWSCTFSSYDTGDGDNSYIRADFSVVHTDAAAQIYSFDTDEDMSYTVETPFKSDVLKADTSYRALVYYDNTDDSVVKLRGISMLYVITPKALAKGEVMKNDPVDFESLWISKNGRFLNLAFNIMIGEDTTSETASQMIGMVIDKKEGRNHYLTLYHAQNSVPEYYSHKMYMSIPVEGNFSTGDVLNISINTYDGVLEKTVSVP